MKRSVSIEVTSVQRIDGESMAFRTVAPGIYNKETGLMSYSEETEDGGHILTTIRIGEDEVCVKKSGSMMSEMIFHKGMQTAGIYRTGFGNHELLIDTEEAKLDSKGKRERIILKYTLNMDGQVIGETEMYITATYT